MARSTAMNEDGSSEKAIDADDVSFNALAIAGAWEAVDDQVPTCVAVAITNEFTDHVVTAEDGVESDRDVLFGDAGVLFEEKAVGVCSRETAEQYAPAYVELERDDGFVLAINPAQIFDRPDFRRRDDLSTTPDEDEVNVCPDCGAYAGTRFERCVDCR